MVVMSLYINMAQQKFIENKKTLPMRKHISLSTKEDSYNQNESKLIVKVLIINKSKI